ncbi:hypothetical protein N599_19875 [Saccharopolyspora erythraea D]|nr:hypothetical protein N599_19875 [Saccharopolyspora erythraea D]
MDSGSRKQPPSSASEIVMPAWPVMITGWRPTRSSR